MKVQNGGKDTIVPAGQPQKCLRDKSWRDNICGAVKRIADPDNFRLRPACGSPMVIRQNNATGDKFWAYSLFRLTGCKGKRSNGTPPGSATRDAKQLAPWEIVGL